MFWILTFVAAFGLRVLYVLSIRHAPFFHHLQTEPLHYQRWVNLILNGPITPAPPFEQAPGYAYFVAAVYLIFGHTLTAVALVQAALDAATCVLIAAAARIWFGTRVGLLAGALAAAYGPFIYFCGELLPSTLFLFVIMLATTMTLMASPPPPELRLKQRSARRPAVRAASFPRSWTLAGTLWGLAAAVRSEVVLAWPFVLCDAWIRGGRAAVRRAFVPLIIVMMISVGINAAFSHKLVLLTTSGGVNLWLGNNPHADGVNPFIFGPLQDTEDAVRAQAHDAVDADRLFRAQALRFWRQQPGDALRLLWKKFVWTWTGRELPNTGDIGWQTAQSWLFRLPLFPIGFGAVLPFACAGAILLGRGWRCLPLLAAPLAVGVGTSLLFFTNARFRLIMAPALLILAAVGIERLAALRQMWRRQLRVLGLSALAMGLGLILAWGNFYDVWTYRVPQISVNTGVIERESGNFPAAVRHLREGLALDPHDGLGWVHLALALEQEGQPRAALQAYLDALDRVPDDTGLQQMAARFWQRQRLDPTSLRACIDATDEGARKAAAAQALRAFEASPP